MISAVRGTVASKVGDRVVVETAGGVSYEIAVPVGVLERLPVEGRAVELKTVLVVREDSWALYGFDGELERTIFQRLLGASGVGPRVARALGRPPRGDPSRRSARLCPAGPSKRPHGEPAVSREHTCWCAYYR